MTEKKSSDEIAEYNFQELKWKLQRDLNCSFPPEWISVFKMFYDAGREENIKPTPDFIIEYEKAREVARLLAAGMTLSLSEEHHYRVEFYKIPNIKDNVEILKEWEASLKEIK